MPSSHSITVFTHCNISTKPTCKAFSLLELSFVLVIISIFLGFTLSYAAKKTDADRLAQTQTRTKELEKALYAYINANRSLPCPADPSLSETDANFGLAQRDSGSPGFCIQSTSFLGLRSNNMVWGMIPTKTLNIRDSLAYDGWGRKFSYIMIETCNADEGTDPTNHFASSTACGGTSNTQIQINDASGTIIMNNAIFTIISHGKNGVGGFNAAAGNRRVPRLPSGISADEATNAHVGNDGIIVSPPIDQIFVARIPQFDETNANYFDDIVLFKNKTQIINNIKALNQGSSICNIVDSFNTGSVTAVQLCGTKTTTDCQNIINSLYNALIPFCY
ncbi:type II secretion system protein [Rickettsiales endosymbiont of Stachyamoeba lipophora]|uniref:type II secretion system protein n=1 Tax=Rickettsiales endosymbiont of Stachyamoeba lipophora TaxID=2486578 RepID=UPI000F649A08|nr:type II secretion system protein [Rickettsiales endosymbiont of Stachyamoeba lipophora]AZL15819.1 type II secretion system protein [Rickettsiales endosymbiont of Stachyamoeba lipophora]